MQKIIIIVISFLSTFVIAGEELKLVLNYEIKKDTIDPKVSSDSCLIVGIVKDFDGNLLKGAAVNTIGMKFKSSSNSKGEFQLMLPKQSSSIFCFKPEFNEVVTSEIDFKGGHRIEIHFKLLNNKLQLIMDKPVLYLYSEDSLSATIRISPNGELGFTYPKYKDRWNVEVNKQGLLVEGQKYPYLFWEAQTSNLEFVKVNGSIPGEIVATKNAQLFFEKKLSEAGLNFKEKADFITFWAPRFEKNESYFVQFILDENYQDRICEMAISPKPNSIKRIYMLVQKITDENKDINYVPQKLSPIVRKGFTVIEWGGSFVPETIDLLGKNNKI